MTDTKTFQENLKTGVDFEQNVCEPYLLKTYPGFWLFSYHDNRIEDGRGPRIKSEGERDLILPDFEMVHTKVPSNRFMVEAKYKEKAFSIRGHYGKQFVAIDEWRCLQYEKVAFIQGSVLLYLIGCKQTNGVYKYISSDWMPHYFNNRWSKGSVRAFELRESNRVGDLT